MTFADALSKEQAGGTIRGLLSRSAEPGYRPRDCNNCGRRRLYVCFDGQVRCEKCRDTRDATDEDLAEVFGSIEGYRAALTK